MSDLKRLTANTAGFMGAREEITGARYTLIGAPMDFTVSFRPGARQGPMKIREVSYGLEEYSPYLNRSLAEITFYDAGDLELPLGNVSRSLERIGEAATLVLAAGHIPCFLGGEHLISYPVIKAVADRYPDLAVIHFDAHADLRADYSGETDSHATVMRKVATLLGGENLYQFGIRSGTREEFAFAREHTHIYPFAVLEPLRNALPALRGRPVYVSLDIDVVDPAFAPGTGTPEPGGCSSHDILTAIHLLGELNVVGFDLVEVAPVYDQSERTSLLAAKIVREALLAFA